MSFGFDVGDIVGVAELAWGLYKRCYILTRNAPQEFTFLLTDITILSQSLQLIMEEAKDLNPKMIASSQNRVLMMRETMTRIGITLKECQRYTEKYETLQSGSWPRGKQVWTKFKRSNDASKSDIDSLRNSVCTLSVKFGRQAQC